MLAEIHARLNGITVVEFPFQTSGSWPTVALAAQLFAKTFRKGTANMNAQRKNADI